VSAFSAIKRVLGSGVLQEAPSKLLKEAESVFNSLLDKGHSTNTAHKAVYRKTGVDLSAPKDMNYEGKGVYSGLKVSKSVKHASYDPSTNTIEVSPKVASSKKLNNNAKEHESQHAYDRYLEKLKPVFVKYDASISSLNRKLDIISAAIPRSKNNIKHVSTLITQTKMLRKKAVLQLQSMHEVRARIVGNYANVPREKRPLISVRFARELKAGEKILKKYDRRIERLSIYHKRLKNK